MTGPILARLTERDRRELEFFDKLAALAPRPIDLELQRTDEEEEEQPTAAELRWFPYEKSLPRRGSPGGRRGAAA